MSHHTWVPADTEPDTLDDLISDARWLVVAAPPVVLRPGSMVRPAFTLPTQRVIDITDRCVDLAAGFGE